MIFSTINSEYERLQETQVCFHNIANKFQKLYQLQVLNIQYVLFKQYTVFVQSYHIQIKFRCQGLDIGTLALA